MAYGGVPVYVNTGRMGQFFTFLRIDGLTLDPFTGNPADPANPDTGQLTTGIPGPNQTAIPDLFGRRRGQWRPEDANLVVEVFSLLIDPLLFPPTIAVPATVLPSPRIIDGNLVLTHQNIQPNNTSPVRFVIQYLHPMNAYSRPESDNW